MFRAVSVKHHQHSNKGRVDFRIRNDIKSFLNFYFQAAVVGRLCKALPTGLNDGLLCARGIQKDGGFTGSCKGDSGGPLIGYGLEDKKTLIGIVSGKIFHLYGVD